MKSMLRLGSHGDEVKEWQRILGGIKIDGQFGIITHRATLRWQEKHGLHVDGVVGEETWGQALGDTPSKSTTIKPPKPESATIAAVNGIHKLNSKQLQALIQAAWEIQTNPDYLAAVISFETGGSFSPSEPNRAGSGAIGLIQFMPQTTKRLGTSTEELSKMTFEAQLKYVVKYFQSFEDSFPKLRELYLAVFFPAALDENDDYIIATRGTKVYEQNSGFDKTKKGTITRDDVCLVIDAVLKQSEVRERIIVA